MILTVLDAHAVMMGDLKGDIIFKTQIKREDWWLAAEGEWLYSGLTTVLEIFEGVTLIICEGENLCLSSSSEATRSRRVRPFYMYLSLVCAPIITKVIKNPATAVTLVYSSYSVQSTTTFRTHDQILLCSYLC